MSKTARIEARLDHETRERIAHAAALAGQPLSTFMVEAAAEKAEEMIRETSVMVVPADYFDKLLAELDTPDDAPRLRRAAEKARQDPRVR
jgi:uncharacterized protein (DUF1778 family)